MGDYFNVDNSAALAGYPGDPPDEPCGPSDSEMLDTLDAYGHLNYTLDCVRPGDPECEPDTLLAFDWKVFAHPDHELGDLIVAYHVVFDCPGSIETVASGIFCIDDWTDEQIENWDGAPCVNCVDGVNEGALDGAYIQFQQVDEFGKKVAAQFKLDVASARNEVTK